MLWRLAIRERTKQLRSYNKHVRLLRLLQRRYKTTAIAIQLDYYMSLQFAGIACALTHGLYETMLGVQPTCLPTCPVGEEAARVRAYMSTTSGGGIAVGCVEQNVLVPTLQRNPDLQVAAVAAMFRTSPLAVAFLGGQDDTSKATTTTIGAHADTVELLQRIYPEATVVASPRHSKITDLLAGKYDGIQVYTTTEVPTLLQHITKGDNLTVVPLENHNNTQLGYSQVLFCPNECLVVDDDRRHVVQAFVDATFQGWQYAISNDDPAEIVRTVQEACRMLRLDTDEQNDHYFWNANSQKTNMAMLERVNQHVKETFQGDRLGTIDKDRWAAANRWLLQEQDDTSSSIDIDTFGLAESSSVWQPNPQLLAGNERARTLLSETAGSARSFAATHGRRPSLAVIAVGTDPRYNNDAKRVALYSSPAQSWFTKRAAGAAHGMDVQDIQLDAATTTTEQLLSVVYKAIQENYDGIQLMWPLPEHIHAPTVYNAIPRRKDVDGIHFVGQQALGSGADDCYAPVTPTAVMELLQAYNIPVASKHAVVLGRSPIVGGPVAVMLRQAGATVTVVHRESSPTQLQSLVRQADIVVACTGVPGVLRGEWMVRDDAVLINVGSTFVDDGLCADVSGTPVAGRFSPVPGGIGPLSLPILFRNVVRAAWNQADDAVVQKSWKETPATLKKSFHFPNYSAALAFCQRLDEFSTVMDHHANMDISHRCTAGVDVTLEYFTYESNSLTDKDYAAAKVADMAYGCISTKDYAYNLDESCIATHPASPRGSSKLLTVDTDGHVGYHNNFAKAIAGLVEGSHLVFNHSRVLNARLSVMAPKESGIVELMLLDLGSVGIQDSCYSLDLRAMIRLENTSEGDVFKDVKSGVNIKVQQICGIWHEDEKSDGNGIECIVQITSETTVEEFLQQSGSVPIPPYIHREAEDSDKISYNTVYASDGGSVAAPTAGLHFTNEVISKIGVDNCSFLSLHVGAGTFKPLVVEDARDHTMHEEQFSITVAELKRIVTSLRQGKQLTVVGTTSCRTLESLFWCGVRKLRGGHVEPGDLVIGQFDWIPLLATETARHTSRIAALESLVEGMEDHDVVQGRTALMITPDAYSFKCVDHLITNFHAPDSTLMLLVAAFMQSGQKIKDVYESAQKKGFRFLSYGDCSMLSRPGLKKKHPSLS